MNLRITWNPTEITGSIDLFTNARGEGVLTDEHAACCYGLPVVLTDGVPHGPADLPATLEVAPEYTPEWLAWVDDDAARADSGCERLPEPTAKYTPESLRLIQAARDAGYRLS